MRSSKKRIDYSMINSSGEKVIQSTDMTSCDTKNDTLLEDAEIQTLSEDITDFIDENPIEFLLNVNEVNDSVARIEHLRTAFRHLNHQVSGKLENLLYQILRADEFYKTIHQGCQRTKA